MTINATKETLINNLHNKTGISKEEAKEIIELFIEEIKASLIDKKALKIPGFGSWKVVQKNERMGRNPKTMEEKLIPAHKVVSFTCSRKLKSYIADNLG